jgi:hypothetical protein
MREVSPASPTPLTRSSRQRPAGRLRYVLYLIIQGRCFRFVVFLVLQGKGQWQKCSPASWSCVEGAGERESTLLRNTELTWDFEGRSRHLVPGLLALSAAVSPPSPRCFATHLGSMHATCLGMCPDRSCAVFPREIRIAPMSMSYGTLETAEESAPTALQQSSTPELQVCSPWRHLVSLVSKSR